uniref:DUF1985 domain-containing protein n=1 Tax=Noccaea caerulescens TaxID=107243 RepID=A0A1J3DLK2_NOCCA
MVRTKNLRRLEKMPPSQIVEEEDPPTGFPPTGFEREENFEQREENSEQSVEDNEEREMNSEEEENNSDEEEKNSERWEDSDGNSGRTMSDREDEEDGSEVEPMQHLQMYFPPSEYKKKIKISTRCYIAGALETLLSDLNPSLTKRERSWFEMHPQFKHILHMPRDKNHKLQGMWMLLLRTACTEKEKEAWFVVNGVPIRYSIKEHALISGLDCHNYPFEFTGSGSQMGKMDFVNKYFKKGSKIRYQDVKAKLLEMGAGRDRLNMAVLFFLSSIIKGLVKTGKEASSVDPFLLRAVNDLE